MIWFSPSEIGYSIICSLIYGAVFAALVCFVSLLSTLLSNAKAVLSSFVLPNKVRIKQSELLRQAKSDISSFITVLLIILFTLGYILLSYYTLDGSMRSYTLLLSVASLLIFRFLFSESVCKIILIFFNYVFIIIGSILGFISGYVYKIKKLIFRGQQ